MKYITQEVIRYIDLRFKENDLRNLTDEIDKVREKLKNSRCCGEKELSEQLKNLMEFRSVLTEALSTIRK